MTYRTPLRWPPGLTRSREAGIDLLVNNAGTAGPTKPIEHITPDEWRRCLAVGLDGQFHCARRVVPRMKSQQAGAIINIASTAGVMGMPYRAPYVAAKFGVIGLTKGPGGWNSGVTTSA